MPIIVQKFGGTSVADPLKIRSAAEKAVRTHDAGYQVVVVVSAMGKTTDALIETAGKITKNPPAREMDLLLSIGEQQTVALMAMAIHELGREAIGITAPQLGIETDSKHTVARIKAINTGTILGELDRGRIVVAAGFQGIDKDGNITTLGRGGSDTTAVALAAELRAERCEIYTDVDGVYTIDPRLVPTARKLDRISYDEMLELASLGALVMHSRSIEFAKKFSVQVYVRSSFHETPGTTIGPVPETLERGVCGAAVQENEARVTILGVPDQPGTTLTIFKAVAEHDIIVDMVVQNIKSEDRTADVSFTVLRKDLSSTLKIMQKVKDELSADRVTFDDDVSKISVVGKGMALQHGVASRAFRAIADAGVNIIMISTSVIKISVLVPSRQARAALWAVHQAFELDKKPDMLSPSEADEQTSVLDKAAIRHELALAMDENVPTAEMNEPDYKQALVTLKGVPDRPGLAADVFEAVAEENILVDMIVQDAGISGRADLSFTVPKEDLQRTCDVIDRLTQASDAGPLCQRIVTSDEIAILSVGGVGLRSHTGVAVPMFAALATEDPQQRGINVRLINTSEVCISIVVDAEHGEEGSKRLKAAFRAT